MGTHGDVPCVVYASVTTGEVFVRTKADFTERLAIGKTPDGEQDLLVPRFVQIELEEQTP